MRVLTPSGLDHALALLAEFESSLTPLAGGTDLLVSWPHQNSDEVGFLDLSPLRAEHSAPRLEQDALVLSMLTTYWDVIASEEVRTEFPLLLAAALKVGAVQIQSAGTWAGNIANGSPAADGVPVLMAYGAEVVLRSTRGEVRVPLDRYYLGYKQSVRALDQLIVEIRVPRRKREIEWFHKVGARFAQAISKLGVAVTRDETGHRVVVNSVAPTVVRCRALEDHLDQGGKIESVEQVRALLSFDIAPIDDIRSTSRYRESVLSRLLYFYLRKANLRKANG